MEDEDPIELLVSGNWPPVADEEDTELDEVTVLLDDVVGMFTETDELVEVETERVDELLVLATETEELLDVTGLEDGLLSVAEELAEIVELTLELQISAERL